MRLRTPKRYWNIHSTSKYGKNYIVTLCSDESFICECPDFQYRDRQCKHIRKAKRIIAGEKQKNKLPEVEL